MRDSSASAAVASTHVPGPGEHAAGRRPHRASSSTSRMVSGARPHSTAATRSAGGSVRATAPERDAERRAGAEPRRAPAAGLLTMPYTVARPRPVPLPGAFVVKNGSKMLRRTSRRHADARVAHGEHDVRPPGSPVPPRLASRRRRSRCVSVPPPGIASRALTARFMMTCSIWPGSACTGARLGSRGGARVDMSSPIRRRSIGPVLATTSFRSSTCGCSTCWRLNASSWRVSAGRASAARWISSRRRCSVGIVRGQLVEQQLGVAVDDREQVVEVVRDAAGQPADRFHLLRLAQLLLAARGAPQ